MVPCPSCGRLLDSVASQCGFCGAPVPTRAEPSAPFTARPLASPLSSPPLSSPPLTSPLAPPSPSTEELLSGAPTALGTTPPLSPPVPHAPVGVGGLLLPGQLFDGKYRIERQLGSGGMSVVYVATEVTVETRVVIKALLPHLSQQPGIRERLLREARALARIDHPNVVGLRSVVTVGSDLFLVMEFVDGQDLAAKLEGWKQGKSPGADEIFAVFGAVLDGVEAAHKEGIIHRDIKPSNVLVRERDGRIKVTDFGIAKSASDGDHQLTSGMIGTLFYMAPEQLRADPTIDARADVYALGVLLFEMLTCAVPFYAASSYEVARLHIQAPFPSLRSKSPALALDDQIVAMLDVVLARACAKERADRYASCDELRKALAQCSAAFQQRLSATSKPPPSSSSLPTAPTSAPPAAHAAPVAAAPQPSSKLGLLAAAASVAVIGAVGGWWFLGEGKPTHPQPGTTTVPTTPVAPGTVATATATATSKPTATARPTATATATATATGAKCAAADDCKASTPKNATPVCFQGACGFECPKGLFNCGDACLDLRSDVRHCGSCGGPGSDCTAQSLPAGASARCVDGRCDLACAAGAEKCGKSCCAAGQRCDSGKCAGP